MLLRLRLANHRSARDEVELSLVSSQLRTVHPPGGDWARVTNRVAGIYGANASGKSTVLSGLRFVADAVRDSATRWSDETTFPHQPFALDAESKGQPSLYEIDFTIMGVRNTYGFRSSVRGVDEEWLYSYPEGRRRLLFERAPGEKMEFGRNLAGDNVRISKALRPTQLFVSLAGANRHPVLAEVRHHIVRHFRFAQFDEGDQRARLRYVIRLLAEETALKEAEALLSLADLGISGLEVVDMEVPDDVREAVRRIFDTIGPSGEGSGKRRERDVDAFFEEFRKQLSFVHGPEPGRGESRLTITDESSGTVAWLALAVPALESIRTGTTFVVDEIDSSLHPRLTASLIGLFKDDDLNKKASQLVFTSHDTSLLGRLHGNLLLPEEVWLTEKSVNGVTDLYSLAEFSVRERDNLERRYMHGRYGAVPTVSQERLSASLKAKLAS